MRFELLSGVKDLSSPIFVGKPMTMTWFTYDSQKPAKHATTQARWDARKEKRALQKEVPTTTTKTRSKSL